MVTRVCVYQPGGDYGPQHVQWLAAQVPGLWCVTGEHIPGVPTLPPRGRWPGWWSKMNLFDPDLAHDDLLYFDLDTVVLEVPQASVTTVLTDFYQPDLIGSGLMFIEHRHKEAIWEVWTRHPEQHMRRCTSTRCWGDQGFLLPFLRDAARWGPEVVSYKKHCRASGLPPEGAAAVCFHGKPRPWEVVHTWVPTLSTIAS